MFEFTDADLKLNQRGQLSPSQKEWLKNVARGARSLSRMNAWIAMGFMVFGLCLISVLYLQNESTRAALFSNPMNLLIFPILVLVILGVLALSIGLAYWNARKLESATLLSVTGVSAWMRVIPARATYAVISCMWGKSASPSAMMSVENSKKARSTKFIIANRGCMNS